MPLVSASAGFNPRPPAESDAVDARNMFCHTRLRIVSIRAPLRRATLPSRWQLPTSDRYTVSIRAPLRRATSGTSAAERCKGVAVSIRAPLRRATGLPAGERWWQDGFNPRPPAESDRVAAADGVPLGRCVSIRAPLRRATVHDHIGRRNAPVSIRQKPLRLRSRRRHRSSSAIAPPIGSFNPRPPAESDAGWRPTPNVRRAVSIRAPLRRATLPAV